MAAKKVRHLRGLLTSVSSQRTAYKPYGYNLDFSQGNNQVMVELDIPEECVIQDDTHGLVVVNLDGLKAILKVTADAVDELNKEYIKEMQE